ncbi:hypothetical protein EXN66_Car009327 [Channa argus]|uniref:Uncharacterized protein n=1 Tax=Channa argus TaxID=215402 RepID=A0A6G1PTJ2_CHAAH|nr:hypothetical protein EXN66_Car009327 [Channa argus]
MTGRGIRVFVVGTKPLHMIQTTPCCVTLATTRSWLSRRSQRVQAERVGETPPDVLGARAAIQAALAFPSAPPCCPPLCA